MEQTHEAPSDTAAPSDELRPRVVESIRLLLPRVLGRDLAPPAESAVLFDELGLTSANTLSLLLELEEELDIQIDVEEISQDDLGSLGSLADFVAAHAITEG
jgi:acyl carrier protein